MSVMLDGTRLVTIYGGSGFVGRHVVRALARTGCRIRVAVRRPELAGFLQPLGDVGQITIVQTNIRHEESVRRAALGADIVVNLVGILANTGKQKFDRVQRQGAGYVAKSARDAGVKSFVHMSAIGADELSASHYANSKGKGEELIHSIYADTVILRPSIIFGPEDNFFNRFADMAVHSPFLPAIGGGHTRFQPVYVGDIAQAAIAVIEGKAKAGEIYELGGPEVFTFRELMHKVSSYTGRKKSLLSIPFFLARFGAFFAQLLPSKPLTVDQVRLLQKDNIVSRKAIEENRTLEELGIEPRALDSVVPGYLEMYRQKGQFSKDNFSGTF